MSKKFFFSAYIAPEIPSITDVDQSIRPKLYGSDFSSLSGSHIETQWQVASDSEFTDILYDSGATGSDLTEHRLDSDLPDFNLTCYARVRYKNDFRMGIWSEWSGGYQFNTGDEPVGEETFTSPGSHSFTPPWGVYSVCAVCIGAGAGAENGGSDGGGGGGLGWKNNIPVSPGNTYTVIVGAGGDGAPDAKNQELDGDPGGDSSFQGCKGEGGDGRDGGGFSGDGGGSGGRAGGGSGGGGGAGGYTGSGGDGGNGDPRGTDPSDGDPGKGGGSGGGSGGAETHEFYDEYFEMEYGGDGGNTGTKGEGSNGDGGTYPNSMSGEDGSDSGATGGGGGHGGYQYHINDDGDWYYRGAGDGHNGVVRIIWGPNRSFPDNAA